MASFNSRHLTIGIAAILLVTCVGCGGSDWGYLEGTVTLNGQPVGPGTISLQPVSEDRAGATAGFGADGKFTVMSAGRKQGARTGEYVVVIRGGENLNEETVGRQPVSMIPARYSNPTMSDLRVTIQPGKNTVEFDLKP
jgi:hypothetical protein